MIPIRDVSRIHEDTVALIIVCRSSRSLRRRAPLSVTICALEWRVRKPPGCDLGRRQEQPLVMPLPRITVKVQVDTRIPDESRDPTRSAARLGEAPPILQPTPLARRQRPGDYRQRLNGDAGLVFGILGMEMRWCVVGIVHLDDNAIETADLRHARGIGRTAAPTRRPICRSTAGTWRQDKCRGPVPTQWRRARQAELT